MSEREYPGDDFIDHLPDDSCPECGGEGVIHDCPTDYECVDPESGCDLCERMCDCRRPVGKEML